MSLSDLCNDQTFISFTCIQYNFMTLVSMYETEIEKKLSGRNSLWEIEIEKKLAEKCYTKKSLFRIIRISAIIFSPLMFLIEEVQNVFRFYKHCEKIKSLRKKHEKFGELSVDEKNEVKTFFNAKTQKMDRAQKIMCRETSIQVVLQLTLILYQESSHPQGFRSLKPLITAFLDFIFFSRFENLQVCPLPGA